MLGLGALLQHIWGTYPLFCSLAEIYLFKLKMLNALDSPVLMAWSIPSSLPFSERSNQHQASVLTLKMRRLRALFNPSLLQKASSSFAMAPPFHSTTSTPHNHLDLAARMISSFLRGFSTVPASSDHYEVGFVCGHRSNRYRSIGEEEEVVRYVPVKAYFLSTRYSRRFIFYFCPVVY